MSAYSSSSCVDCVALHLVPTVHVADAPADVLVDVPADVPVVLAARVAWNTSLSHRCVPMNVFLELSVLFLSTIADQSEEAVPNLVNCFQKGSQNYSSQQDNVSEEIFFSERA